MDHAALLEACVVAAREAGAAATLVMPAEAPVAKVTAVREYGGEVRFVEGGYDEAGVEAARLVEDEGMTFQRPTAATRTEQAVA